MVNDLNPSANLFRNLFSRNTMHLQSYNLIEIESEWDCHKILFEQDFEIYLGNFLVRLMPVLCSN